MSEKKIASSVSLLAASPWTPFSAEHPELKHPHEITAPIPAEPGTPMGARPQWMHQYDDDLLFGPGATVHALAIVRQAKKKLDRAREAAAYYRQAREIDSDDPEWTEKLALLEAVRANP